MIIIQYLIHIFINQTTRPWNREEKTVNRARIPIMLQRWNQFSTICLLIIIEVVLKKGILCLKDRTAKIGAPLWTRIRILNFPKMINLKHWSRITWRKCTNIHKAKLELRNHYKCLKSILIQLKENHMNFQRYRHLWKIKWTKYLTTYLIRAIKMLKSERAYTMLISHSHNKTSWAMTSLIFRLWMWYMKFKVLPNMRSFIIINEVEWKT